MRLRKEEGNFLFLSIVRRGLVLRRMFNRYSGVIVCVIASVYTERRGPISCVGHQLRRLSALSLGPDMLNRWKWQPFGFAIFSPACPPRRNRNLGRTRKRPLARPPYCLLTIDRFRKRSLTERFLHNKTTISQRQLLAKKQKQPCNWPEELRVCNVTIKNSPSADDWYFSN